MADIPEVDRSQKVLTNGQPVPEDWSHTKLKANGQQEGYIILTEEERKKGFVRPVRRAYQHVGIRPKHPTRFLTESEKERYKDYNYVEYEEYPENPDGGPIGRFWTYEQLHSGCGTVTTMALSIAETFARDPGFYGGGFCCGCRKHFPNEEFVWDGTDERVGS